MAFSCELWDCRTVRIIELNSPHATYWHSEWSFGAGGRKLSFSLSPLSAAVSRSLSLSLLGGWVPVWRSRLIDGSICVGVITAWLIGREERWDIVITDTPVQPLTHADGRRDSPLYRRRERGLGGEEHWCHCVLVCVFQMGVKKDARKAVKPRLCEPSCILSELGGGSRETFVCCYFG